MRNALFIAFSIVLGATVHHWYAHRIHSATRAQFEQGYDWRQYPDQR